MHVIYLCDINYILINLYHILKNFLHYNCVAFYYCIVSNTWHIERIKNHIGIHIYFSISTYIGRIYFVACIQRQIGSRYDQIELKLAPMFKEILSVDLELLRKMLHAICVIVRRSKL